MKQNKLLAHSEKFYWWHGHVIKWYIDKRLSYYSEKLDQNIIKDPTKYMVILRTGVFHQIDDELKKNFIKSKYLDVYFYQLNSDFIENKDSTPWAMASNPEALLSLKLFFFIKSGIKQKLFGLIKLLSTENFFLFI